MNLDNRALCFAYRNPPPGRKKLKFKEIRKLVKKLDGQRPSIGAIAQAVKSFQKEKNKRGRKEGQKSTSKEEDRAMVETFKKLWPPGCGIDSREIHEGPLLEISPLCN